MAINRHPWQTYGIDSMIAKAARSGPAVHRRDPAAEAVSNLLAVEADGPLIGSQQAVSYWLPSSREQVRTLVTASATNGGNLVAGAMLARVAEAARPRTVLEQAGASRVVVPLGTAEYAVPRFEEATAGSWLVEDGTAEAPALTVATGTAVPKLAAAKMVISRRLRLQTLDPLEPVILQELQRSNQSLIEGAFFNGGGGKEPLGIVQTPGVSTASFAGALPTWAELVGMVDSYLDAHGDFSQAAWFVPPGLATAFLTTEKAAGSGTFVMDPGPQIAGRPVYISAAVPSGKVLLLDPSRLISVYWGQPALIIDPYTFDITGDTLLIVHNGCDLVVGCPAQVVIGTAAS
jgi:HK97 family phage major capsid protein